MYVVIENFGIGSYQDVVYYFGEGVEENFTKTVAEWRDEFSVIVLDNINDPVVVNARH